VNSKHFSSPREEALIVATSTRKRILDGEGDAVDVLRACSVIANTLNKEDDRKWIINELEGYKRVDKIPSYRKINLLFRDVRGVRTEYAEMEVHDDIHFLSCARKKGEPLQVERQSWLGASSASLEITTIDNILAKAIDRCLDFLNKIVAELQYGGMVEYLMEEIRQETDQKLATLDNKIAEETQSLFVNLASNNPADWSKVGHSCRKILKFLADKVFPSRDQHYKAKDGRVLEVGDSSFINRLFAFLDMKAESEEKKFLSAEIEYFESYLRETVNYAQMVEHNPTIEKFHANMLAIHTYLIASEVLKHI
jgi:hypothetical protein